MTYQQIHTAFINESMDLALATEKEVLAYSRKSGNEGAHARWDDYQEELRIWAEFDY